MKLKRHLVNVARCQVEDGRSALTIQPENRCPAVRRNRRGPRRTAHGHGSPLVALGPIPDQKPVLLRRQQALVSSIQVGDEVLTAGGIVGRITALEGDRVHLEVAPGMTLTFLRPAITRRLGPELPEEEEEPPDEGVGGSPGEGLG